MFLLAHPLTLLLLVGVISRTVHCTSDGSHGFKFENFTCPKVSNCSYPFLAANGYVHFTVGLNDPSSVALLLHRVCECFKKCIPPERFVIVLHTDPVSAKVDAHMYNKAVGLLKMLHIKYIDWNGPFTANLKMENSMSVLQSENISNAKEIIYHTDLDEIPKSSQFQKALAELKEGRCDAVRGQWVDRVAIDGSLSEPIDISSTASLATQFPLICKISEKFVPERTTWKIILYRANLRLVSGQHDVWCNMGGHFDRLNPNSMCKKHISRRVDKSTSAGTIFAMLPSLMRKPIICKNTVIIYHYKFIKGVRQELVARANNYRAQHFSWYKQSENIVKEIDSHGGRLDVNDTKFDCYWSNAQ